MKKVIFLVLLHSLLFASTNIKYNKYDTIFKKAGKHYHLPWFLIKMVAITENSKLKANLVRKNKNGTEDIGLMQINTLWIKLLHKKFPHINKKTLKNPIVNIYTGGYILYKNIKKYGYSWKSVGYYHSFNSKYSKKWIKRVKENIKFFISWSKRP